MASYFASAMTGALEEGVAAIHGYKALKQKAWGVQLDKELVDLRKDEEYIQKAADNVAFVKQQKEFSDDNSVLMLDWLFKNSPALFSTETKTKAVDRAKGAFDNFPGILFNKETGVYSIDFNVDQLDANEITGLARGDLATSEQTVENFQLKNREESRKHLINSGLPKHLTTLFLGKEVDKQVPEDTTMEEGTLTVSGYLKQAGAEWLYNTYLPDAVKWTFEEFTKAKLKEYLGHMATKQKEYPNLTIASFEDVIEATGDKNFWTSRGFDDLTVNYIRTEYGKFDMKAMAATMDNFNNLHTKLFSNVQTASIRYSTIQEELTASIKAKGIKHKDTEKLLMDLAQAKIDYSRANEVHSTMWESHSKKAMGLTVSPFSGLAGSIGLENVLANFRHASASLKLHGITINTNELMNIFNPENKEVKEQIHIMSDENKTKFITYKSKTEPGYTFIIMENGMAIKVADKLLE